MRIVIAEDAAIMRDGLAAILTRRGHEVAAAVGDAEALLDAVADHLPDVAVADVRMPPTFTDEGLRAAAAVRRRFPTVGVWCSPSTSRRTRPRNCSAPPRQASATC